MVRVCFSRFDRTNAFHVTIHSISLQCTNPTIIRWGFVLTISCIPLQVKKKSGREMNPMDSHRKAGTKGKSGK